MFSHNNGVQVITKCSTIYQIRTLRESNVFCLSKTKRKSAREVQRGHDPNMYNQTEDRTKKKT